jgi:predicted esterase
MSDRATKKPAAPGFVVLHQVGADTWQLLGEVPRTRGLPARAARTQAILAATDGSATAGEVYAAVLRSEWRVAMDWAPPDY